MSSSESPGYPAPAQGLTAVLPLEKVFPIQIGSELFRLSGASISSDAPSYFSQFFEEQLRQNGDSSAVRTLYIDRDPDTFRDILKHLQGYYIRPRDNSHFVKLFADAQFYSLPRLISQLFECEIFIQIGDRHFEIPRDIFSSPGDSPNFFSLGFAVFFATPGEVFPGLERRGLLRPPAITPPIVSSRSGEVFAELLHMLRGYPIHIRSEEHRAELLRDCRYFHLRGLEQKLIPHHISYNIERQRSEIVIRLEDIRPSGVQVTPDHHDHHSPQNPHAMFGGWVQYARPFVDDKHYELIIEIGGEDTRVDLATQRVEFYGSTEARMSSLLQVIANKTNLQGTLKKGAESRSRSSTPGSSLPSPCVFIMQLDSETDIVLDGERYEPPCSGAAWNYSHEEPAYTSNSTRDGSEGLRNLGVIQTGLVDIKPPNLQQSDGGESRQLGSRETRFHAALEATMPDMYAPPGTQILAGEPPLKRKRGDSEYSGGEWTVHKAHWRLRVQARNDAGGVELILIALKLDGSTRQRSRNVRRRFLGSD
ncbi:hypothetical protein D8B26_002508 [Coccidioides posadasii str. Silveira]|nr:K+ channel tetramerisation domain containing protein [Coccidioides posadasii C735 delta SOWgp]EER29771.1 K+ channel tetramerisation domain containing protein [Coccidioides posadasii C735 delta SOWgp]QVM07817.1 hypothetical protein D8B26_002508 [Coccidioides posadasii str. Silveira]|eukprot:XP_003071916.1 K+ channel tetramerisation domain containing protein [Coccidioides posadasii C735 delta SOWgp]